MSSYVKFIFWLHFLLLKYISREVQEILTQMFVMSLAIIIEVAAMLMLPPLSFVVNRSNSMSELCKNCLTASLNFFSLFNKVFQYGVIKSLNYFLSGGLKLYLLS